MTAYRSSCDKESNRGMYWAKKPPAAGMARYVDSSVERLQIKVTAFDPGRYQVLVNGIVSPLQATSIPGQFVCGVRYRAWQPPSCLHPNDPRAHAANDRSG